MAGGRTVIRVAAIGDVHCGTEPTGTLGPLFAQIAERADLLLLCGDLTNHGFPDEARAFAKEVSPAAARIPVVGVLGNHEYESGHQDELRQILGDAGVKILDGDVLDVDGVGVVGVKGFGGGFGARALQAWGEDIIKRFVRESVDEALKLESALARMRTDLRLAVLHYAPIQATVEGEPLEIYPFLGSSRLEDPLGHYPMTAVFHGHAHHGKPEGRTRNDVPVYNVAMPLLANLFPDRPPFRLLELPAVPGPAGPGPGVPAASAAGSGEAVPITPPAGSPPAASPRHPPGAPPRS